MLACGEATHNANAATEKPHKKCTNRGDFLYLGAEQKGKSVCRKLCRAFANLGQLTMRLINRLSTLSLLVSYRICIGSTLCYIRCIYIGGEMSISSMNMKINISSGHFCWSETLKVERHFSVLLFRTRAENVHCPKNFNQILRVITYWHCYFFLSSLVYEPKKKSHTRKQQKEIPEKIIPFLSRAMDASTFHLRICSVSLFYVESSFYWFTYSLATLCLSFVTQRMSLRNDV